MIQGQLCELYVAGLLTLAEFVAPKVVTMTAWGPVWWEGREA